MVVRPPSCVEPAIQCLALLSGGEELDLDDLGGWKFAWLPTDGWCGW